MYILFNFFSCLKLSIDQNLGSVQCLVSSDFVISKFHALVKMIRLICVSETKIFRFLIGFNWLKLYWNYIFYISAVNSWNNLRPISILDQYFYLKKWLNFLLSKAFTCESLTNWWFWIDPKNKILDFDRSRKDFNV